MVVCALICCTRAHRGRRNGVTLAHVVFFIRARAKIDAERRNRWDTIAYVEVGSILLYREGHGSVTLSLLHTLCVYAPTRHWFGPRVLGIYDAMLDSVNEGGCIHAPVQGQYYIAAQ